MAASTGHSAAEATGGRSHMSQNLAILYAGDTSPEGSVANTRTRSSNPAPIAYINVVAVKKPVVGFESFVRW